MNTGFKLLVLFCLLLPGKLLYGQPYYFRHYQVENGLSTNTIYCSLQDQKGFLWFGTKDGLNRFDGYTFKIFRNDPDVATTIGNDIINSLCEDQKGLLWIGTEKGLFKYSRKTESFSLIKATSHLSVKSIQADKGGLWFILDDQLARYEGAAGKLRVYDRRKYFETTALCVTSSGTLWVSTSSGLLQKYNPARNTFESYDLFRKSKVTSSPWIGKICDTGKGLLLIGTNKQGVKLFDSATNTYKDILTYNIDRTEIYVRDIIKHSEDTYWIASESGIFILNIKSGKYTSLRKRNNDPYSLSDNAIYTLCTDREGGIWAGTFFGGLNYYPKPYAKFEKFFPYEGYNSICGNAVREICEDRYGYLWIGTEDAGLNKYDPGKNSFKHFTAKGTKTSISYPNIHGILATGDTLLIGTFEHGLDLMNIKTGGIIGHYSAGSGKNTMKSNFIVTFYKTRKGKILIGTTRGLYTYNVKNKDFTPVSEVPPYCFIYSILEDSKGTIWVGTISHGIYYFNFMTNEKGNFAYEPTNKHSLSNNRVNGIFEDSNKNLWFATEAGGLCKFIAEKRIFKRYSTKQGFPSNTIFKILEDKKKNLWISTAKGLVCFNPLTEHLKVHTKANGLLSDLFNYNSAYKDSRGRMYFGSVKGLIRFNPDEFVKNTFVPPVYITGFQVYNKELEINKERSPLKKSISFTDTLTLKYNQSSFSIDFAALSYTSPNMTEYAYKMEGLDEAWTYLKTNRKAYFTELAPGSYVFKVKASNSSDIWNEKGTTLLIQILPPLWATPWAYALYTLIISTTIYYGIRTYHRRIKDKNRRKLELLEHKKEKEIYQAKIEFFTNVAHEIRTPLTLIKGPMEKVIRKAEEVPAIKNNLKIMERNTDRLLNLTSQLLDFRKTETRNFSLNFVKVDICDLLKDNFLRFKPAVEQKKLRFKLELSVNHFHAYVDQEALNKILSNLLNNAIKYSAGKVYVCLLPLQEGVSSFSIQIKNDGFIIPPELKEKIFETFYRIEETANESGTGIGLSLARSLTELHKGRLELKDSENNLNIFQLTLPVRQEIEFNLSLRKKI